MVKKSVSFPICHGQDLEAGLGQVTGRVMSCAAPLITDREMAYAINIEFDRIRDALMQDRSVWEQYKYFYWWRKYQSSQAISEILAPELREEFCCRIRHEFERAMKLGQLRKSDFEKAEWHDIRHMIDQANGHCGFRGILRKSIPNLPGVVRRKLFRLTGKASI